MTRSEPEVEKIYVHGGNPLRGTLRVSGSKNASLPMMAACLLVDGKTTLRNVPDIGDTETMADMLRTLGAHVKFHGSNGDGHITIDASGFCRTSAPEDLVRKMRASFYVLGPMLARLGEARIAQPGGCMIGARPVDFHVRGLQALGANLRTEGGIVEGTTDGLRGANIYLDFPSAGATTHLMTAACLAEGTTVIENAATEPEVADFAGFLRTLGGSVEGAGTPTVTINGVERLRPGGEYAVIPDRMEAGTYACAAAITRGDIILENVIAAHMQPLLVKLQDMGVSVTAIGTEPERPGFLRIMNNGRCRAVDILAMPHPGFPTDMQQPMVALLGLSDGAAAVTDRVFENRFRYVSELQRMGADIRVEGRTAFVHGVERFTGAAVTGTDLRASAALIIAALAAEGESAISGVEHLDRGYAGLVEKLQFAGADIRRWDADNVAAALRFG